MTLLSNSRGMPKVVESTAARAHARTEVHKSTSECEGADCMEPFDDVALFLPRMLLRRQPLYVSFGSLVWMAKYSLQSSWPCVVD